MNPKGGLMDKNDEKPRRIPRIVNDDISLRLWSQYVSEEEQNDVLIMKNLLEEVKRKLLPSEAKNPILIRMISDGAGFDGLNAVMMTYGYLEAICHHYINKAEKK